jgi:hypothetical protein
MIKYRLGIRRQGRGRKGKRSEKKEIVPFVEASSALLVTGILFSSR